MARKKWTPQTEVTDELIRSREKRKWQVAYRRYVLEKAPSESYARYFGLDFENLRNWFELQFTPGLDWENFGKAWQFDHVLPTTYFDYSNEDDLLLCWNFINIHVGKLDEDKNSSRIGLFSIKPYFQGLYDKTGFYLCGKMLHKINAIEMSGIGGHSSLENFILDRNPMLEQIAGFDEEEFNRLNKGNSATDILLEREILRKFGSGPKP
jgi:hypothetical protein